MRNLRLILLGLGLLSAIELKIPAAAGDYFLIRIVDAQTGRGVPLVELRTVNKAAWWTDSGGLIAFDEPGLMDREVYFQINSPGYDYPKDAMGYRGIALKPIRGRTATIQLKRLNIAERLYRVTGQGIYRDSVLAGQPVPLKQPVLDGQVMGQDSVVAAPYRGKIYWFWGDTDRPSYPLGNFKASGATSELPDHGGLDPSAGVDLNYFVDGHGTTRAMCPQPAEGLHWIESVFTVPDERGVNRLVARVANMRDLGYAHDYHLMIFNDERGYFEPIKRWDLHEGHGCSHPFLARTGNDLFYYLFPDFRVPADLKSLEDLNRYQAFTCLDGDGKWRGPETPLDRGENGRLRYAWRAGADRIRPGRFAALVRAGKLKPAEAWSAIRDVETGAELKRGFESVAWNPFRRRWIAFFADQPGDVWFGEADTPLGPWGYGRRIATHGDYNFYNLAHHEFFDQDGGRLVYFEGTYTAAFSGAREKTPRYDYNQMMYRLALDDPRLALPVAIYRLRDTNHNALLRRREQVAAGEAWRQIEEVAWFALPPESRGDDLLAIYATENHGTALSPTPPEPHARPLFFGLPLVEPEQRNQPERHSSAVVVLNEYRTSAGQGRRYSIESQPPPDCEPVARPLCRVWRVPGTVLTADWEATPAASISNPTTESSVRSHR